MITKSFDPLAIFKISFLTTLFFTITYTFGETQYNQTELQKKVKPLQEAYTKAIKSTGAQRKKHEKVFFELFPASWEEMDKLYFWQTKSPDGFGKYFSKQFKKYKEHLGLFCHLTSIDVDKYNSKYIDIAIGIKKWKYYNSVIAEYHTRLITRMLHHLEPMLTVLSKRKEQEIVDFFDVLFITYLPRELRNKGTYQALCNHIKRIASNKPNMTTIIQVVEEYISLYTRVTLLKNSYKALQVQGEEEKEHYETLFLEAFPDSFQDFKNIYFTSYTPFCEGSKVLTELYGENEKDHIRLFSQLAYVDKSLYYDKYINIASDSVQWKVNDEHHTLEVFHEYLFRKLFYNTEPIVAALSKHNQEKIIGFFQFVLNGPLPENMRGGEIYQRLWNKLKSIKTSTLQIPAIKRLFRQYISLEQQAAVLIEYCERALNTTGKTRAKYERLFFKHFPASFQEFQTLYLCDKIKKGAVLGDFLYRHTRLFCNLGHIDKKEYYNKYLNIYAGGAAIHPAKVSRTAHGIEDPKGMLSWLDNLAWDIEDKTMNDSVHMLSLLASRTDSEIVGIFWSLFNNGRYRKQRYDKLYAIINEKNVRMRRLLQEAYEQ
ncbi:MAG: hypothetical protein ACYC2U_04410 [Candidatus Amoebophilus sp.]